MANKNIFKSNPKVKVAPPADTINRAGGKAYKLGDKAALAQYAATGTFNDTFYSTGQAQLDEVLAIANNVDPEFIAKVALYSKELGRMKDMPAFLCAHLVTRGDEGRSVLYKIFPVVINNGRMIRNFVQMMRSGAVGRKSLGTVAKKLVRKWFHSHTTEEIFKMSVGNDPSLADAIRLAHVDDLKSPERAALFAYLLGYEPSDKFNYEFLPPLVKEYEKFKDAKNSNSKEKLSLPKVPWEMLAGLPLSPSEWVTLAQQASWTQLRMNLNTFARHGVFKDAGIARTLAAKLKDPVAIEKANPFPYQIFTAYLNTNTNSGEEEVPVGIKNALHDALEVAVKNVPTFDGKAFIAVDTSGSMKSPVTGFRKGSTTSVSCVDVASLIACTFLKKNRESEILPFDTSLHKNHGLNPNDSVMTNADKLRRYGGGGTDCRLALADLNKRRETGNLVIYVSDNESWIDSKPPGFFERPAGTGMAHEWNVYKARNPKAKLVCIDLQASPTVQVKSDLSALNIGGFSDSMWEVIKSFVEGVPSADHWVNIIDKIQLPK